MNPIINNTHKNNSIGRDASFIFIIMENDIPKEDIANKTSVSPNRPKALFWFFFLLFTLNPDKKNTFVNVKKLFIT